MFQNTNGCLCDVAGHQALTKLARLINQLIPNCAVPKRRTLLRYLNIWLAPSWTPSAATMMRFDSIWARSWPIAEAECERGAAIVALITEMAEALQTTADQCLADWRRHLDSL